MMCYFQIKAVFLLDVTQVLEIFVHLLELYI